MSQEIQPPVFGPNLDWNNGDPGAVDPNFITPDALMAYCQSRMQGLDKQMQTIFVEQQKTSQEIQDLNQLAALYNQWNSGINAKDANGNPTGTQMPPNAGPDPAHPVHPNFQDDVVAPMQNYINSLPDGDPLKAKLQNDLATLTQGGDTTVSAQDIAAVETDLKNYASDLSSGQELNMIQLQSLMSQRQTAIQLTTNLVQSLGDQANKIADNVGK